MIVGVVYFDVGDAGELFERRNQGLSNAVGISTGLTVAGQIECQIPIAELQPSISDETIALCNQAAGLLLRARAFEVFVHGGYEWIVRRGDLARN